MSREFPKHVTLVLPVPRTLSAVCRCLAEDFSASFRTRDLRGDAVSRPYVCSVHRQQCIATGQGAPGNRKLSLASGYLKQRERIPKRARQMPRLESDSCDRFLLYILVDEIVEGTFPSSFGL